MAVSSKPVHHTLDIYGAELHLATTAKAWKRLRRTLTFLDDVPDASGLCHFAVHVPDDGGANTPHLVLWIDPDASRDLGDLVDTCAHEASHAAGQLFEHLGHDTRGTDEPSAYLVGWLTGWLIRHVHPD